MKIAAVQMVSSPDWENNRERAAHWVAAAAAAGARLVALPEYFCLMGQRDSDKLALAEPAGAGPIQDFLSGLAREHELWLVGGTLPVAGGEPGRALNRCCVFAPDGREAAHYDKLHLFAFDNGRESYDEGRTLRAGSAPVALDLPSEAGALRLGLSICYDLRFPELYRALMNPPCDLLVLPAAFTHTTGQAHWELLLRARAVENQCYVLASAQGGTHPNGRRTWGHSMVIDPWGTVLDVLPEGEGFAIADLDPGRIKQVRLQLPALAHRRL
ncbi:Deaminated glutathione amidase [Rubrivivax sp. A210]|uniref:carbon-nitrogen hydrolase family protein n=1 Tax=Rubrivivax sp. A210 TaxID=2772301 RepID=UPI0019195882|nr:carbon-nitrogen hydrolase family protein [Rubrivivax sp. A210]CAD5373112.1 Deaminated glutathione amidase [Rubrivivax sp. A210]